MKLYKSIGIWQFLFVLGFLIITGVNPYDRFTWLLEISWVAAGLVLIIILSRKGTVPTNLLAWMLTLHAFILIYGGWYTYERVPLGDWMKEMFGFERNHYDRIGHFAQGFIPAVLIREVLMKHHVVNGWGWLEFVVFAGCMAFTGIFEIIEFAAAKFFADASDAYLGSQGDVWDAQWDMLLCAVGTIVSILLFRRLHIRLLETAEGK
jgi:putative membrane protein